MHRLTQIYEEAKYDVHDLLRLHKMAKDLRMEKPDIINVLDLVKNNQVETLQSKVDSLKDEIKMWEIEKTMAKHRVVRLKRTIFELEWSLAQKRGVTPTNQS
jgi:peptidoglycan hydrolase CwlO-like protein